MNSRERVLAALNHREPDRVPLDMVITINVYEDLAKVLGLKLAEPPKVGPTHIATPTGQVFDQNADLDVTLDGGAKTTVGRSCGECH